MPEIKINNISYIAVPEETILKVAQRNSIHIPTMCWVKDLNPSTSCMVCMVQDMRNGKILTSCSALVEEGMDINTENEEVTDMRKSALELLLSEHYGDCEAPCQRVCPAGMEIPLMNRLISENKIEDALKIVRETIALPAILGYICPAPCEKACRRKDIDDPVSICLLKRFVAENEYSLEKKLTPSVEPDNNQKIAIIGSGPAGLAAAFYFAQKGFICDIYDSNTLPGGKLRTDMNEEDLPRKVLDTEIETIKTLGVKFYQNRTITTLDINDDLAEKYRFILCTTGTDNPIDTNSFIKTGFSDLKELTIFKIKNSFVFSPKQLSYKSNMAVRAAALGRMLYEWTIEFIEKQTVSLPDKKFNSVYKKISIDEQAEFLKEAGNHFPGDKTHVRLQGFTIKQAINEASRCLHCDCRKKESCVLRDLSSDYKASQRVYTVTSPKKTVKNTDHELIIFENLKCIKCGVCIQTAQEAGDKTGFAFSGRGFDVHITIPIEKSIRELTTKTALSCAKNCPTGAISLKKQSTIDK